MSQELMSLTALQPIPVIVPQRALSQNPAAVYLARLSKGASRVTTHSALNQIARLLTLERDPKADAFSICWASLRYQHVQALRSMLQERVNPATGKKFTPATCNKYLAAVRGVLRECWRLRQMSGDDYERARDVAGVKGERLPKGRALTPKEIDALGQVCGDGTSAGARNAALLAVLYAGGLRRSEVVALSLSDWNASEATLKVKGKGNKERLVHLKNGAVRQLEAWLRVRGAGEPSEAIFVSINKSGVISNRRLTSQAVFFLMKEKLGEQSGVAKFSPHDLRRSHISDLLEAGADIATVSRMVGHADIQTTRRYDRRGEAAKARAAMLLNFHYVEVENVN